MGEIWASGAMAEALKRFGAKGRLGGVSDPRARSAQADRGGIVTRDDYRTGEKAAGISSLLSCRIGRTRSGAAMGRRPGGMPHGRGCAH